MAKHNIIQPGCFGEFYGWDKDFEELEIITIARISPMLRKKEPLLYRSKWFDYRRLHPALATYLWAHEYNKAYTRVMVKSRDAERGQYIKGFKGKDIFEHKEITGVWKARQMADELGIRYDFYIRRVMNWCENRSWTHLPRPKFFYDAEVVEMVKDAWEKEQRAALQLARDPWYAAGAYYEHMDQVEYQKWMVQQVKQRKHKDLALHFYLVQNQHMLDKVARGYFDGNVVQSALSVLLE